MAIKFIKKTTEEKVNKIFKDYSYSSSIYKKVHDIYFKEHLECCIKYYQQLTGIGIINSDIAISLITEYFINLFLGFTLNVKKADWKVGYAFRLDVIFSKYKDIFNEDLDKMYELKKIVEKE